MEGADRHDLNGVAFFLPSGDAIFVGRRAIQCQVPRQIHDPERLRTPLVVHASLPMRIWRRHHDLEGTGDASGQVCKKKSKRCCHRAFPG